MQKALTPHADLLIEGIIFHNAVGIVVKVDDDAARLLGIEKSQLIGKNLYSFLTSAACFPTHNSRSDFDPFQAALLNGTSFHNKKFSIITPDGGQKWLSFDIQPIIPCDGKGPTGLVSAVSDITASQREL